MAGRYLNYSVTSVIFLVFLFLCGCGGGDGTGSINTGSINSTQKASLKIDIVWPYNKDITGQVINPYLRQVDIAISWSGGSTTGTIVDPNTTITFTELPVGSVTAVFTGKNAQTSSNIVIGSRIITETLQPGLNTTTVNLGVSITGNPSSLSPEIMPLCLKDTLLWVNNDTTDHTIVFADDGSGSGVNSGSIAPGGTFSHQFNYAGTYPYSVDGLNGKVIVGASKNTVTADYKFVNAWSNSFNYPVCIAVDRSGNVFVTDNDNHLIKKFDFLGNYITQWGSSASGTFDYPTGIAVDGSGNVFVFTGNNQNIAKFDGNGNYITEWNSYPGSMFSYPCGIAVDGSGNVFVADTYNNRIVKFDNSGNYITKSTYSLNLPYGIAVDGSGNVFVADKNNNRIVKFDENCAYIAQWNSWTGGSFTSPKGIAVDGSGNVFVADTDNNRIVKFDASHAYTTHWSSWTGGTSPFTFNRPWGIAVDGSGNVFVVDMNNNRIVVFASQ